MTATARRRSPHPFRTSIAVARARRTLFGALRVAVAAGAMVAAFFCVGARVVYGHARDGAMHFGDELLRLAETRATGDLPDDAYRLRINEQSVQIANTATKRPVTAVLDHFEAACREQVGGIEDEMKGLDAALNGDALPPLRGDPGALAVRDQRGDRGFVVCFDPGGPIAHGDLVDRVRRAVRTGDLGAIGGLRYVTAHGEGDATRVVAAWTDGAFDVHAMFPAAGDAPGRDFPGVPRPRGSRRILTAFAEKTSYAVDVYEVAGDADAIRRSTFDDLSRAGLHQVDAPDGSGVAFASDAIDVLVALTPIREGVVGVSYVASSMR